MHLSANFLKLLVGIWMPPHQSTLFNVFRDVKQTASNAQRSLSVEDEKQTCPQSKGRRWWDYVARRGLPSHIEHRQPWRPMSGFTMLFAVVNSSSIACSLSPPTTADCKRDGLSGLGTSVIRRLVDSERIYYAPRLRLRKCGLSWQSVGPETIGSKDSHFPIFLFIMPVSIPVASLSEATTSEK